MVSLIAFVIGMWVYLYYEKTQDFLKVIIKSKKYDSYSDFECQFVKKYLIDFSFSQYFSY